jgi:phosphatidylglycerophosphate synthase
MTELSARRPLKSRSTGWARAGSRTLLQMGVKPNQVSAASVFFALGVPLCLLTQTLPSALGWFGAAACIQLRLLCNLMDGMLAVEGGLKTPHGDLYNEFPDRLADVIILSSLGHAGGDEVTRLLGWLAACGALMTAFIRMHGASLIDTHDFQGPQAKPHRMAVATLACLLMMIGVKIPVIAASLGFMVAGIAFTIVKRLRTLSHALHERALKASTALDP